MQDALNNATDTFVRDPYVCVHVVNMNIISRGHQDDVRLEALDQPRQNILIYHEILLVSRAGLDWDVVGKSRSLAPASLHVLARVGIVGVLVRAEIEDAIVFFEDMLSAVSMVGVVVDDEYSFDAGLCFRLSSAMSTA